MHHGKTCSMTFSGNPGQHSNPTFEDTAPPRPLGVYPISFYCFVNGIVSLNHLQVEDCVQLNLTFTFKRLCFNNPDYSPKTTDLSTHKLYVSSVLNCVIDPCMVSHFVMLSFMKYQSDI